MASRHGKLGALRRALGMAFEAGVFAAARFRPGSRDRVVEPRSILVLRNNDLGDVLVATPLFAALRRLFPDAHIVAGVGSWAAPVLQGNPNVDEILHVNAPWYNKFVPNRSIPAAMRFIYGSETARELRKRQFDLGIDVLGSHFGSLLMLQANIPQRLAMRGFAGGESGATLCVDHDPNEHVARESLKFAEILGLATGDLPEARPQLFLRDDELRSGMTIWRSAHSSDDSASGDSAPFRIAFGTGDGSLTKHWPRESYLLLAELLATTLP